MCVNLHVSKVRINALVDTGACHSLMNAETWRDICRANHRQPLLRKGLTLKSLTGHTVPTKGKAAVMVYGKQLEFYIVDHMYHNVLLLCRC